MLEESLMRMTHYPGFEFHKQQHEDLMAQVLALQHKLDEEKVTITFELLHFLKNWLVQHINESDKRFGAHFQTAGLGHLAEWTPEVKETMNKKKWWWKFW
jgi:hemerythrin